MLALTVGGLTRYLPEADKESAMQTYWEARQSGDATAALVKVAGLPPPSPDDDDPTDPSPVAPALAGEVSVRAAARIHTQERWLMEAGFSLPPPLFAPGTRVHALGDENFRIERERVEALPSFLDAAGLVGQRIAEEERQDVFTGLRQVAMTDDGALVVEGQRYGLEPDAFLQLTMLGGFSKGIAYLRELCDPALRALNVNHQLARVRNRKIMLRTRKAATEGRQVFAVVTPTYAAVDTDVVLRTVAPALSDSRAELRYRGTGAIVTALWMPDEVLDLSAGDVFKVGVRIETDDTGRGCIRLSGVAFRNLCLNLLIIGEGEVEAVSLVHKGDPERILDGLAHGLETARGTVGRFLQAWGQARTVRLDPVATIRSWVASRQVGIRGQRDPDALVERLLAAWHKEPGDTLADCLNAVTRAAHEEPSWDMDVREALERQAARLVLVPR